MHVQSYTIPKFPQKTNCEKTRRTKHQKPPEPFQTETLRGMQTRQRLFTSLLGHGAAHTVLKIPRIAFVQHSLVEYCESKLVSFRRCGISRKRYHSFKRAGLGMHVILCRRAAHTSLECTVHSCHGKCGIEMIVNVRARTGKDKGFHQQFGRCIII